MIYLEIYQISANICTTNIRNYEIWIDRAHKNRHWVLIGRNLYLQTNPTTETNIFLFDVKAWRLFDLPTWHHHLFWLTICSEKCCWIIDFSLFACPCIQCFWTKISIFTYLFNQLTRQIYITHSIPFDFGNVTDLHIFCSIHKIISENSSTWTVQQSFRRNNGKRAHKKLIWCESLKFTTWKKWSENLSIIYLIVCICCANDVTIMAQYSIASVLRW